LEVDEMPIYEYLCDSCGNQFELKQKFSDEPAKECPKCGGAIKKMISQSAFALKGSGWYSEGYNSKVKETKGAGCPASGSCSSCPSAA
jgi:putative FmdB family regulatory protein